MPNYKVHLVGGCASFISVITILTYLLHHSCYTQNSLLAWFLLCALAGSLFPDIDTKSKGQFYFSVLALCALIFAILFKRWSLLASVSLVLVLPLLANHRGITHQVWFILLAPLCMPLIASYVSRKLIYPAFMGYIFFVVGALSHVLLDFGPINFFRRGMFGWPKRRR